MSNTAADRYLAIKAVMMPRDTNRYGTIFGGVLLSYIDQAGAVGAHHVMQVSGWGEKPLVTVAINRVEFLQPVHVGETVSFWTCVRHIGRTSITMHISVETERQGEVVQVTDAEVTYVAVDLSQEPRKPVPIRGGRDRG